MKSVSKKLKIVAFNPLGNGVERNTVRIRMNISYRNGNGQTTKTVCVRKDVLEMDFMFFESLNKNHLVFHDEVFIAAHLMHMRHDSSIKKLCENRPDMYAEFNTDQFKAYIASVEPDGLTNFSVNYGVASYVHNGRLYSLPNVVSIIIPDPTGRMQKISALAAMFE